MPVIWQATTSCRGVEAVGSTARRAEPAPSEPASRGTAKVWPLDRSPVKTCELDKNGTHINLALSEVFPASCPTFAVTPAMGILDLPGPVSPLRPGDVAAGMEGAMHAQEAHFVFGAAKAAGVKPWLNDAAVFLLGDRDAGPLLLSPRIQLPIGKGGAPGARSTPPTKSSPA